MTRHNRQSGIYRIGLGGGWFYGGSSKDLAKRERQHLSNLRSLWHHSPKVQAIWSKYQVFEFVILELCPESDLLIREQAWLDTHFGTEGCANLSPTAGRVTGFRPSIISRQRMSDAQKSSPLSVAHLRELNDSREGKPLPMATREAMSVAHTGVSRSVAVCEAISAGLKVSPVAIAFREQLHESLRGVPKSEAHCTALSEAAKRRAPITEEHRAIMIAAQKLRRSRELASV